MTCTQYDQIEAWFRKRPVCYRLLRILNRWLPLIFYAAYPIALLYLAFHRDSRLLLCIVVPAIAFLGCTVVRHGLNRPRPYEVWNIHPLIQKNKSGHSFPSRHMTCAGVIAMTFYYLWPTLGVIFFIMTAMIAVVRVVAGIHFTKDVLVGGLIGIAIGLLGFFLL